MPRLFVDRITVIDAAVLDRLRGLVGVSWIVDAALEGDLDEQGMVFDFGPAKRTIKEVIDATADHKLIVPMGAPGLDLESTGGETRLRFVDDVGARFVHRGPEAALCRLDAPATEPGAVATLLRERLAAAMPANVRGIDVRLRDELIEGACYSYCHGLKKHAGHCQRIAHGHRSRLEIWADGERSPARERRWADRWRDVYLGSREDLRADPGERRWRFGYTADEGEFELELDASRCDLLDGDTTVENIAAHIAASLKAEEPRRRFVVRAYEGVDKGAEASA
ncbi:hypothetical protein PC39_13832 [Salinisphaera sp. PC39]|uniref:6-carboxytetrahydropterin synthase n=1 Tax=Salinisphaera sp. PC39 TaxID=1304156 RepID=UPI00333F95DB